LDHASRILSQIEAYSRRLAAAEASRALAVVETRLRSERDPYRREDLRHAIEEARRFGPADLLPVETRRKLLHFAEFRAGGAYA
jgi:hypothetical protein